VTWLWALGLASLALLGGAFALEWWRGVIAEAEWRHEDEGRADIADAVAGTAELPIVPARGWAPTPADEREAARERLRRPAPRRRR
jgi:hypothetical protein